jgi:twitching motility protein PilT
MAMAADLHRAEIDVPVSVDSKREPEVNKLFRWVMKEQASDLHLKVGQPPMMRVRGDIKRSNARPMTQEDMERLLLPCLNPKQRHILDEEGAVDFSYVVGQDECRFRVSLFRQRGRLSLVSRRVNTSIPTFAALGLPESIEKLCNFPEGLIILAGVTGARLPERTRAPAHSHHRRPDRVHVHRQEVCHQPA